jgi:hypothetical protein
MALSPTFSRYNPVMKRTFALRTFNIHETEINQHCWSFKVVSDFAGYIARKQSEIDRQFKAAKLFHASGPDAGRIPETVSQWLDAREDLENWLRSSAVISASSYLETYIRQVVRSALMSDPLSRYGYPRCVDGVALLKKGIELPYGDEVEMVTKGEWNKRAAAFKKLFHGCPPDLASNIAKLERIRTIRNRFAHGFGRTLVPPHPINQLPGSPDRVSNRSLISYLNVISKVAAAVDEYLLLKFIGNFELIFYYHNLKDAQRQTHDRKYTLPRYLQRSLNRDANMQLSTEACQQLIDYYNCI